MPSISTPPEERPLARGQCAGALLFAGLWVLLFLAGMCIDSAPYRQRLAAPDALPLGQLLGSGAIAFLTYTLTNVPILCVLASLLGAIGRMAILEAGDDGNGRDRSNPLLSATLRGFFVYILLLASVLVVVESAFTALSPEQYVRLAGFSSVVGFMVSYNPEAFSRLLRRAAGLLDSKMEASANETPPKP